MQKSSVGFRKTRTERMPFNARTVRTNGFIEPARCFSSPCAPSAIVLAVGMVSGLRLERVMHFEAIKNRRPKARTQASPATPWVSSNNKDKSTESAAPFLSRSFGALSVLFPFPRALLGWLGSHRWCSGGVAYAKCMTRSKWL